MKGEARSTFTPFGRWLYNQALEAECETQQDIAAAIRRAGYRSREGDFKQNTLSHLLRNPNPPLTPAFWLAVGRAFRISGEELHEGFAVFVSMAAMKE